MVKKKYETKEKEHTKGIVDKFLHWYSGKRETRFLDSIGRGYRPAWYKRDLRENDGANIRVRIGVSQETDRSLKREMIKL